MPELSGYDATREIRQYELEKGLRRVPIVAFTASSMPEDKVGWKAAGIDAYLQKPVEIERLEMCIAGLLSQS